MFVQIPKTVSKSLSKVSICTAPETGAVHRNHTDASQASSGTGSPASNVASTFDPEETVGNPETNVGLSKESFGGAAKRQAGQAIHDATTRGRHVKRILIGFPFLDPSRGRPHPAGRNHHKCRLGAESASMDYSSERAPATQ